MIGHRSNLTLRRQGDKSHLMFRMFCEGSAEPMDITQMASEVAR